MNENIIDLCGRYFTEQCKDSESKNEYFLFLFRNKEIEHRIDSLQLYRASLRTMNTSRDSIYFWTIIWSLWFNRLSSPATNTSTFSSHHLRIYSDRPRQAAAVVDNLDKSVRCFLPLRVFTSTPVVLVLFWGFFASQNNTTSLDESQPIMSDGDEKDALACVTVRPGLSSLRVPDSMWFSDCPPVSRQPHADTTVHAADVFIPLSAWNKPYVLLIDSEDSRWGTFSIFFLFSVFFSLSISLSVSSPIRRSAIKKSWDVWLSCLVVSLVQICLCFRFF